MRVSERYIYNGAKGYLIKNHTPEHLKQMIRIVYNGTGVMEEHILENLTKNSPCCLLSDRKKITEAINTGLSELNIAERNEIEVTEESL